MSLIIRAATKQDIKDICLIGSETFNHAFEQVSSKEKMEKYLADNFSAERITQEFNEPGTKFFLAYFNNELAAYAKIRNVKYPKELEGKRYIELERIYAYQKFQGKKIGLQLILECLKEAKENNLEVLWLFVWNKNEQAIKFYKMLGFSIFGESVFLLDTDQHKGILMKHELQ
jgi:ribosomal protein S18 acetylase RimI-like enzyme